MTESKRPLSVEEIFMKIRGPMGQTWPVGTFNQSEIRPDAIEGEYEIIEKPEGRLRKVAKSKPRNLISQQPSNPSPEATHG